MIAVQNHVHTLEHEALRVVFERKNTLAAKDTRPVLGNEILNPRKELVRIERLVGLERNRLHLLVVIVLEAVAMMMVVTVSMVMLVVMVVVMTVSLQK